MIRCILSALLLLLAVPAAAQDSGAVAIVGADVYTPGATLKGATVVFADGVIESVQMSAALPAGTRVIDGRGKVLTPGFVSIGSSLGLTEVGLESSTRDANAEGDDPVRAAFDVADAYNPRSSLVAVARREGVTSALVAPSGGLVSGQGAWVSLAGQSQDEALRKRSVSMHSSIGGSGSGSRAMTIQRLRALLDDARFYNQNQAAFNQGTTRDLAAGHRDLAAMAGVLRGEMPLVVVVNRAADIEAFLRLVRDYGIGGVIVGGAEAWMHADAIARAKVPVLVNPLGNEPGSFDSLSSRADSAALLEAAGVDVIISVYGNWGSHNVRKSRQLAGNAVRAGLSMNAAIDAITVNPAAAFGMDDYGAIEVGKRADLVLWSGDPLELSSRAELLFVGGAEQSLESRQTQLRDRYMEMPGTPNPPLDLP